MLCHQPNMHTDTPWNTCNNRLHHSLYIVMWPNNNSITVVSLVIVHCCYQHQWWCMMLCMCCCTQWMSGQLDVSSQNCWLENLSFPALTVSLLATLAHTVLLLLMALTLMLTTSSLLLPTLVPCGTQNCNKCSKNFDKRPHCMGCPPNKMVFSPLGIWALT